MFKMECLRQNYCTCSMSLQDKVSHLTSILNTYYKESYSEHGVKRLLHTCQSLSVMAEGLLNSSPLKINGFTTSQLSKNRFELGSSRSMKHYTNHVVPGEKGPELWTAVSG